MILPILVDETTNNIFSVTTSKDQAQQNVGHSI